ncbi:MAG: universal stress protein [Propionibacteriales bacterium]|nr:universal stress protein [Propionibacteriales bacterium]
MSPVSSPVLVAFDGSDDATRALHWALDLAERRHQSLSVVVVALDPSSVAPQMRDYEEEFAASAVATARDIIKHTRGIEATVSLRYGWVLPVLHEEAERADLLVVGSRGHGLAENHWLGSVSQHLAGHVPCSVAVIRQALNPRARQIVVGIDGSLAGGRALTYACDRASITGESILAVYAYRYPTFNTAGLAVLPEDVDTTAVDAAERMVAELAAGVAIDYPDLELRSTAVIGRPGRVLARLSDDASLVVVGSRGHNTFQQIVLGSVAQETLHRADCSVVVVR